MNEFENGFHNENLENNRINNQENNSQQVAIDVTPIEESVDVYKRQQQHSKPANHRECRHFQMICFV